MTAPHRPGSPDCRAIFARLSEYLDDELEFDPCSRLEEHLEDCPPCQAFLESLRRTVDLARNLPAPTLPDDLKAELLQAYRNLRQAGEK